MHSIFFNRLQLMIFKPLVHHEFMIWDIEKAGNTFMKTCFTCRLATEPETYSLFAVGSWGEGEHGLQKPEERERTVSKYYVRYD